MRAPPSKCKPPACFFKFIRPGHNCQLSIPKSFTKYLKNIKRNTRTSTLRRGSQEWVVKIVDGWVFGEGWENFVRENGVQDFDFVVFKHEGDMVFDIMVFNTSFCEREYLAHEVKITKAEKSELGGTNTRSKRVKSGVQVETHSSNEKTTSLDHDCYPYFIGTLKSTSWKYRLYLPTTFARSNGLSRGKMVLRNGQSQTSWTVDLEVILGKYCYTGRGWKEFHIANGLKEGDCFKLELVQTGIKPTVDFYLVPKKFTEPKTAQIEKTPNPSNTGFNPYFKCTVTAYSLKQFIVNVPIDFARSNGLDDRDCEMVVIDEKQLSWPAKLRKIDNVHVRVFGLRPLQIANGLKEGHEFYLELVDNGNKPLMKFHHLRSKPFGFGMAKPQGLGVSDKTRKGETCFKSAATSNTIKTSVMNVPLWFARANGLDNRNCEMVVVDEQQRRWPTKLSSACDRVRILGLQDLHIANGSKDGDVFLLQLVDNGNKPIMSFKILGSKLFESCVRVKTTCLNCHPYFVATLKPYSTSKAVLYLPKKFAISNGLSEGELILKNVENKGSWMVNLSHDSGNCFYIKHGWREFCVANGLQKGDSFRFELIQNGEKPVANISRVAGNPPKEEAYRNPYFKSIVTMYRNNSFVNMPLKFARSNGLDNRNCEMVVMDEERRQWTMKLCKDAQHVRIRGFRRLLIANGLKEGNEFLLELVHNPNGKKPLMNFHGIKASEELKRDSRI